MPRYPIHFSQGVIESLHQNYLIQVLMIKLLDDFQQLCNILLSTTLHLICSLSWILAIFLCPRQCVPAGMILLYSFRKIYNVQQPTPIASNRISASCITNSVPFVNILLRINISLLPYMQHFSDIWYMFIRTCDYIYGTRYFVLKHMFYSFHPSVLDYIIGQVEHCDFMRMICEAS